MLINEYIGEIEEIREIIRNPITTCLKHAALNSTLSVANNYRVASIVLVYVVCEL